MSRGDYQLIYLERELDRGELYFFADDDIKPENVVFAAPVRVLRPVEGSTGNDAVYEQLEAGFDTITEIRMPDRTFKFVR